MYSLVTKRGCGHHQRVLRVSTPAGPRRHWPPMLGSRGAGGSCTPPMVLEGGSPGCCWQWEPGVGGPGQSRAPGACPQGPSCPLAGPCGPFCLCPQACTLGLAGWRPGLALEVPLLVHGQGHWGARRWLPGGCLCPSGALGWPLVRAGRARRPAPSARCVQRSAVGSGPEVPAAGGRAGSRGGRGGGGRARGGRRGAAFVAAWRCEGSVTVRPGTHCRQESPPRGG